MLKTLLAVLAAISMISIEACRTTGNSIRPSDRILAGDQKEVDNITEKLLAGYITIKEEWISDSRTFPAHLVFHAQGSDGRAYQLGVEKLSDYYLCILEIRNNKTTEDILKAGTKEFKENCKPAEKCEICNSLTYGISQEVREELVKYWKAHLGVK